MAARSLLPRSDSLMRPLIDRKRWAVVGRYLAISGAGHLAWETAHLPLYTLWKEPLPERVFAVLHCTGGDILIAAVSLLLTISLVGRDWPRTRPKEVMLTATTLGVVYTGFSEWLNVEYGETWAYSPSMPTLPILGTGLTPVLQWMILTPVGLFLAVRFSERGARTA